MSVRRGAGPKSQQYWGSEEHGGWAIGIAIHDQISLPRVAIGSRAGRSEDLEFASWEMQGCGDRAAKPTLHVFAEISAKEGRSTRSDSRPADYRVRNERKLPVENSPIVFSGGRSIPDTRYGLPLNAPALQFFPKDGVGIGPGTTQQKFGPGAKALPRKNCWWHVFRRGRGGRDKKKRVRR